MEAITAFSLACNVMQTINFGLETASLCKKFYEGKSPLPDLDYRRKTLQKAAEDLETSIAHTLGTTQRPDEEELYKVAKELIIISENLQIELEKCQGGSSSTKTSAILNASKYSYRKHKITEQDALLRAMQQIMELRILIELRTRTKEVFDVLDNGMGILDQQQQTFVHQIDAGVTQLNDLIHQESGEIRKIVMKETERLRLKQTSNIQDIQDGAALEAEQIRDHIDASFSNHRTAVVTESRKQSLLNSLEYPEMNARRNAPAINNTHLKTFQWIYSDPTEAGVQREWNSFVKWLKSEEKVYWISGKAGSGKSSLVLSLVNDGRTKQIISTVRREAIILSAFIWKAGRPLQRSQIGLLAYLLHQLLTQHDGVICQLSSKLSVSTKRSIHDWSRRELFVALKESIQLISHHVFIFIDGLDKIDTRDDHGPSGLLDLISDLAALPSVKLCVGSRRELMFVARLQEYPNLRLQDLTYHDMRIYTADTLARNFHKFSFRNISDQQITQIADRITRKADGVFLWVHLVTRSICNGLVNFDDFEQLMSRIDHLPEGLVALYKEMWNRLNSDEKSLYLTETSLCFHIMLLREGAFLTELFFCLKPDIRRSLLSGGAKITEEYLTAMYEGFQRQLIARCAGLVEIKMPSHSGSTAHLDIDCTVNFIHRSAMDFLTDTEEGREILSYEARTTLQLYCLKFMANTCRIFLATTTKIGLDAVDGSLSIAFAALRKLEPALALPAMDLIVATLTRKHCRFDDESFINRAAVRLGALEFLQRFLQTLGKDQVKIVDSWKNIFLHWSVVDYRHPWSHVLIPWLLQEGADPNCPCMHPDDHDYYKFSAFQSPFVCYAQWYVTHYTTMNVLIDQIPLTSYLPEFFSHGANIKARFMDLDTIDSDTELDHGQPQRSREEASLHPNSKNSGIASRAGLDLSEISAPPSATSGDKWIVMVDIGIQDLIDTTSSVMDHLGRVVSDELKMAFEQLHTEKQMPKIHFLIKLGKHGDLQIFKIDDEWASEPPNSTFTFKAWIEQMKPFIYEGRYAAVDYHFVVEWLVKRKMLPEVCLSMDELLAQDPLRVLHDSLSDSGTQDLPKLAGFDLSDIDWSYKADYENLLKSVDESAALDLDLKGGRFEELFPTSSW